MSSEAHARKQRSIKQLRDEGVPCIEHLPLIETVEQSKRRSTKAVAKRAIALAIVAMKGEGAPGDFIEKITEEVGSPDDFSPAEAAFINDLNPSEHDRIQFAWRYECYWVMLWALGFIEDLRRPDSICDVRLAIGILMDERRDGIITRANLRPQNELLDAADLIYRYHWAVRDAGLKGLPPPAQLEPGVVMERHYALNWLIGYSDQDWDDITTDT